VANLAALPTRFCFVRIHIAIARHMSNLVAIMTSRSSVEVLETLTGHMTGPPTIMAHHCSLSTLRGDVPCSTAVEAGHLLTLIALCRHMSRPPTSETCLRLYLALRALRRHVSRSATSETCLLLYLPPSALGSNMSGAPTSKTRLHLSLRALCRHVSHLPTSKTARSRALRRYVSLSAARKTCRLDGDLERTIRFGHLGFRSGSSFTETSQSGESLLITELAHSLCFGIASALFGGVRGFATVITHFL